MSVSIAQLAPLATKPQPSPNAWRLKMTPNELLKYDAHKHERRATAPLESARISRDKRLDTFDDHDESSAWGTPTPEQNVLAAEFIGGFAIVKMFSQPCMICGQVIPGKCEAKDVFLRYSADGVKAFMFCTGCFDALGLKLSADPLFDSLPPLDQKVWQLVKDGLTGVQIAARLSVNGQHVTQQQVSAAKLRVQHRLKENRQSIEYGQRTQRITNGLM
jgi:hypothetical protein